MNVFIGGFLCGAGFALVLLAALATWKGYVLISGPDWDVHNTGQSQETGHREG